jgi:hypothetical protein
MKHSLIGRLNGIAENSPESQEILDAVNAFNPLWRLIPSYHKMKNYPFEEEETESIDVMSFEIWLEKEEDKNICYDQMKTFVDRFTGEVSYHICTHDEVAAQPCVIIEKYNV